MPAIGPEQLLVVNIAELDEQHLGIVDMINRFHDALLSPDPDRLETVREQIFATVTDTLSNHFAAEQNFMASIDYPGLPDHTAKHREFLDKVERAKADAATGYVLLNSELIKTLSGWFLTHETEEDRGYADYHARRTID